MKHLILIRHAESAEKVTGNTDEERDLTVNGMHQAAQVGVFLRGKIQLNMLLASTAVRANITARIIAEQLGLTSDDIISEPELYQASVGTLFNLIKNADQYQTLAIVAHNPTLSYFAEFLTGTALDDMKPATTLILKLDIGNWKELQKGSATLLDRFDA